MGTWLFEPGHTAAMLRARHMMVTYVRGHFKNVSGSPVFDPENPAQSSADVAIDAAAIWTGQPQRDPHLRSADCLDVENHPRITFKGNQVEVAGAVVLLALQLRQSVLRRDRGATGPRQPATAVDGRVGTMTVIQVHALVAAAHFRTACHYPRHCREGGLVPPMRPSVLGTRVTTQAEGSE